MCVSEWMDGGSSQRTVWYEYQQYLVYLVLWVLTPFHHYWVWLFTNFVFLGTIVGTVEFWAYKCILSSLETTVESFFSYFFFVPKNTAHSGIEPKTFYLVLCRLMFSGMSSNCEHGLVVNILIHKYHRKCLCFSLPPLHQTPYTNAAENWCKLPVLCTLL